MAYNFLRGDRDQPFLLPPDLRDWLPEGHLAWFILDVVDQLDLAPFYRAHRDDGHGHPAYDPKTLLGVLLYAYCLGVRSSRQIERRLREDVAFRVLTANQTPDHVTIARFRVRQEQALAGVPRRVLAAVRGRRHGPPRHRGAGRHQAGRRRRRAGQPHRRQAQGRGGRDPAAGRRDRPA
jgi:transposase